MNNLENVQSLINENTKMVWVETPTNPLMKLADIAAVAKSLRQIIFCLPLIILCNTAFAEPLDLGGCSDASATKYLAGHSDVVAGALIIKLPN
jgi:cystathionine beta-lyase